MRFASILGAALALLCAGPGQALTTYGTVGANEHYTDIITFVPPASFDRPSLFSTIVQFDQAPRSFSFEITVIQGYEAYDLVTGEHLFGNDSWYTVTAEGVGDRAYANVLVPGAYSVIMFGNYIFDSPIIPG